MEKIATDTYTFEKLRRSGYTYVDKTDCILPLVNDTQGGQFFIARPRRFGKSLLVSTLKALFQGKRDLFKCLAIEPQWDWTKTYPVVHLDMGSTHSDTVEGFWAHINNMVNIQASENGVSIGEGEPADVRFENLCHACAAKSPTGLVILTVILNFVGLSVLPEERTNVGRIDMSIRVEEEIYVVELKLDGTAPSALSQIVRNRYHEKFLTEGRRVTLVGINFSTKKRGVASWRSKVVSG